MSVPYVTGGVDYTTATGNKYIRLAFAANSIERFYNETFLYQITTTKYSGEITKKGDSVVIATRPTVTISDYDKGQEINWQLLESEPVTMTVDRAKSFAFLMDTIDFTQIEDAASKLKEAEEDSSEQMAEVIETALLADVYVDAHASNKGTAAGAKYGLFNLGTTGAPVVVTEHNVLNIFNQMTGVANEQNWPKSGRWAVIPSWMDSIIMDSDLKPVSVSGDSTSLIRSGMIGKIGLWSVYSTNLYTSVTDSGYECFNMIFGHESAIGFVSQLVKVEYHEQFENTFAKGMKGLNVHDWKVVKPESLGVVYCRYGGRSLV
jgi:hypothetical protein